MMSDYNMHGTAAEYEAFAAIAQDCTEAHPPRMCQRHPETPAHTESGECLCVACELEVWRDAVATWRQTLAGADVEYLRHKIPFWKLEQRRRWLAEAEAELAKWEAIALAEGAKG